jgi:hypothetical protein
MFVFNLINDWVSDPGKKRHEKGSRKRAGECRSIVAYREYLAAERGKA